MRKLSGILVAACLYQIAFSQNYQADFDDYSKLQDTANQLKTLIQWEAANPKDAELYTCYFNYYYSKSKEELLVLTDKAPSGESFSIVDSLNRPVGFLGSQLNYDATELKKAFDKIDQGIELYPNRLDMRFGKIYALGELQDWENFTAEIIKTIQYSSKNNNNWTWTNNLKSTEGASEFLLDIQTYQLQIYNTGNDDLLKYMREIANEVLKFYPDNIESLSNLSITYLLTEEYDKGIETLLKAEKLNPKDCVVLANIAYAHVLDGNKQKAIEYYEKMKKYGNSEDKEFAQQQITSLKK